MTPLLPAQRAAEEFDRVLGGTATRAVAERYAELLDTVVLLREQPQVDPRADFVGALRSRLMTAAETELVPSSPTSPAVRRLEPVPASRNRRRLGTLAASLVIVGGTAGMAAAASGSLPGEALYPVKLGIEDLNTAIRFDDAAKGRVLLDQAATRLEEVSRLRAAPDPDPDLVAAAVASFRETADSGSGKLFGAYQADGDAADIRVVREFTTLQMAEVADLSGAPGGQDAVLVDAADTLADIDQQARVLCGSCSPGETLAPPSALGAGAAAATVHDLLAGPVSQAQADLEAAEAARVAQLKAQAEENAGQLPAAPRDGSGTSAGSGATPGTPAVPGSPGTSTLIPPDTQVAPLTPKTAVNDLVSGVTGTLSQLTSKVAPGTPLSDGVHDLTDTVDETVDGLFPTTR